MSERQTEALTRWLEEKVARGARGERIPTQSELARRRHLSPTTVQRVVRKFIERGDIHAIPGRGMFVRSLPKESPEDDVSPKSTVDSLYEWIREGIRSGRLKRGHPLPQVKAIQLQFHVGQKAVTRAYRRASESGYVVRIGKRYFVSDFRQLHGYRGERQVHVFYEKKAELSRFFMQPLLGDAFRQLERELFVYGSRLLFHPERALPRMVHAWIDHNAFPDGIVLTGITRARYNSLTPLLKPLLPHIRMKRTSVLMTGSDLQHPKEIHYFCDGSVPKAKARALADFAQQSCRQSVAVVFDAAGDSPVAIRLALRTSGELLARNVPADVGIYVVNARDTTASEILDQLGRQGAGSLEYLHAMFAKRKDMPLQSLLSTIHVRDTMQSLIHELPRQSLCLCQETGSALKAVDVCTARRRRIPDDIAVVSCEDDPASYHLGLTMVSVDRQTLGYLMAHALLNDIPLRRSGRGFMPIPVSVHQRLTT